MKVNERNPPRVFHLGHEGQEITLSHVADIALAPDEQITLVTASGTEFDVVRKAWGYYATPSLNDRLPRKGLRPALVASGTRRYLLLCETGKEALFRTYLEEQRMTVITWLDTDADLMHARKDMA